MTNENLAGLQVTASDLLDKFRAGDRVAISTVCRISARRIERGALTEKAVLDLLHDALEKIGQGVEPNDAFGWGREKGGVVVDNAMRDWEIQMLVRDLLTEGGLEDEWRKACKKVAEDGQGRGAIKNYGGRPVGEAAIRKICKELKFDTVLIMPGME